jgi:hypothetical protein
VYFNDKRNAIIVRLMVQEVNEQSRIEFNPSLDLVCRFYSDAAQFIRNSKCGVARRAPLALGKGQW